MQFSDIIGQSFLKNHLIQSAASGRVPHAQLFIGGEGTGTLPMAIAYAQYLLCKNTGNENTGGNDACNIKFNNLAHPDLHFVYPVATTEAVKRNATSDLFAEQWRSFLKTNKYGNLFDWYTHIDIQNKQGQIGVDEASEVLKKLALKSFEGGYKIMIIWMADKLNTEASNKLLKLLEEPPAKTVFILIAENEKNILQTILSRCQVLKFPPLNAIEIQEALIQREQCDPQEAIMIANQSQGSYNKALSLLHNKANALPYEKWFVQWVRAAFRAKGNAAVIQELIEWSEELAALGREQQKQFIEFCIELFRQALLLNYQTPELVYYKTTVDKFKLENFAPFVNGENINEIYQELGDAIYHIERNGNAKMIFTDLSIKLTRLIHKK
ncbi:DNA polymerase III subunit delta' [Myroides odoratimimus]|uniref:DNA polymerase III subunit delta n=4 Tax=Myroides TaxID=76831 RepID=A0A0S7EA69_9FLAO|nr:MULTISPECIES: DNA polymerase III subunit delta' [Myroides]AJA68353.1 DNA polymerase III, delta subunit [Myroides sp. A21]AJH13244.1 DNA polymerase III subunit delta' [Myroides profundi]ALU25640.1 DNA polymerase III subunit delta' [Myroides odoratimimus]APA91674.1 DNA polymerase III subunit delta' [Myroides sp. ZB35]EHO10798.1 DNA polymerase III, delta' subunit [Myroides odoratimimus CCUG 10230]